MVDVFATWMTFSVFAYVRRTPWATPSHSRHLSQGWPAAQLEKLPFWPLSDNCTWTSGWRLWNPGKFMSSKTFLCCTQQKMSVAFVGLLSYFHCFVKDFVTIAQPLTDLLKKRCAFFMGLLPSCGFLSSHDLNTPPVLSHFDASVPTQVCTDASGHRIGAILVQVQHGHDRVTAYTSHLLSPSKRNYSWTSLKWSRIRHENSFDISYIRYKLIYATQ